jgi:hypothetical protein
MKYRNAAAYALPAIAALLVSCSQETSEPAGEWRPVGDGRSVVHSSTGEVNVVATDPPAENLPGDSGRESPKSSRNGSGSSPKAPPTPTAVAPPPVDRVALAQSAKLQRNAARVTVLKRFVEAHPELGLFKYVKDCDEQWATYTARIRRGETPTYADVLGIEQLIAGLREGQLADAKRAEAIGGVSVDAKNLVIGATRDWLNFLKILREVEH